MGQARDEAGNIWETDAQGNAIRLVRAAGGPQMPADPAFPYQGAQAAANLQRVQTQNTIETAKAPAEIAQATANAEKTQLEIQRLKRELAAGGTPEQQAERRDRISRLNQLIGQINRVETLYDSSIGKTRGLGGLKDYLPTDDNARFDAAGAALSQQGLAAFRVPGTGTVSDRDAMMFDRANLPTARTRDSAIEEQLLGLRSRVEAEMQALGLPPPQWEGQQEEEDRPNPMTSIRIGNNSGPSPAPFGATEGSPSAPPPEMTAEIDALVGRMIQQNGGRLDPQTYAREAGAIMQKYRYDPGDLEGWANDVNGYLDRGGRTIPSGVQVQDRPLSTSEWLRNSAVNNPIGAAMAGALDMGGFGGVSALAGDQMSALGTAQPVGMAMGQIGGSITGTALLGKAASMTAGRLAPRLLGGGRGAQFARNLGTDTAYSGIYGGVSEGDPLTGAVTGGIGSAGGQLIGKGIGRAIGGVDLAPAVQALRDRGIPMTVPQQLGGFAKSIEDKAMSMPLVGDMIRARRVEGLDSFNREAFSEAGSPIKATVADIGQEGIQQLSDQVSDAYGNATQGMAPVPLDDQFIQDIQAVIARGQTLPSDYQATLGSILERRLAPATDFGELTGEGYQQAARGLKASRAAADKLTPGFENDYRDIVSGAMTALDDQLIRGGNSDVIARLRAANAANRNMRTLEDATSRAAGGSETGTPFVFTPSQLQRAGMKTQSRFPGERPFGDLADAGQAVLPSRIPNSGTADRAAQMLLPGVALGGAGIGGMAGGDIQGAGTGAGLSTLATLALLAGGTKTGQKALQKIIIDRPVTMQQLGRQIRNRTGIFGSASLPFLIAD